ncbi:unnamed protein product [Sphagnum compactum]
MRYDLSLTLPSLKSWTDLKLETVLTFVNNVREIFGRADGRTSNCPRCQGSGLLTNRSGWGCDQVLPINNDFC